MHIFHFKIKLTLILLLSVIIFTFFCASVPDVQATFVPDMIENGFGYTSILYDNSNGLPTSEANAIVQTKDGFIWIGGYSGLIRYNGNEFYRYDSATGISSVVCLYVDSKDRLWIGTNDNGIAVMKDNQFTFFNRNNGLRSVSVRSIAEDSKGNIMIATTMGMAYIDKEEQLHLINEPQIDKEYVCELNKGNDGVIYGVTLSGGFFTVENARVTAYYSSKDMGFEPLDTIYPDPDRPGYVYLGLDNDQIIYGNVKGAMSDRKVFSCEPHHGINVIRIIQDKIWCATDTGVGYFENDGHYVTLDDLPMSNQLNDMLVDYEGNLWFSSSRQGVMKVVENRFIDISGMAGLDPMVVNSTCKYGNDLYIGTDKGLHILNEKYQEKTNDLTKLLDGFRIRCIKLDSKKQLWFCTYSDNGLVRYDPEKGTWFCFVEENGLASNRVRMIKELSDGRIAVATNAGVNLIQGDQVVATYNSSQGISNLEILCIEETPDGRLFLGSDGDGIYIVNGKEISRLGLKDGLHSEVILRIKKDVQDDFYWIVTSNSIAYIKDKKCTTITNFPYSNNFDLFFDNNNRIWVVSSNGIYVVNRKDLLGNREQMDYTLYDTKSGMPSTATANSYSFIEDSGVLYLSSSGGVSAVNINKQTENNRDIRLDVSFVLADDVSVQPDSNGEIHIPASCKRLNIYPNAFTYSLNNPKLSYYLEGFDEKQIEVNKQNLDYVTYTNLKGGSYQFNFSILNTTTGQKDKTISVKIIKDMAFYEMVWFRVVVVLLLIAGVSIMIILYFRRKTAILMQKQETNQRLINEITEAFAKCVDIKDKYTNGHSFRVAKYAKMFAERLGKTKEECDKIYNIALLHDIGKISIPLTILNKPGKLDDEEYTVMKTHPTIGFEILKNITIEPDLALGAEYHHERIDGKGYPSGLKGDDIPEVARIIGVADTFDAMHSTRPYRKKMSMDKIIAEIKRCSGTQLDPKVVEVFLQLADEGTFDDDEPQTMEEEKKEHSEEVKEKSDGKKE